jgi:hypothetical protein
MTAKRSWQVIILAMLFIAVFVGAVFLHYRFAQQFPGGTDSVPRWVGTQAWVFEGLDPYSDEVTARAQQMVYNRLAKPGEDKQKFAYPFYVVFYYLPFIWLNYNLARAIAMVILEGSLVSIALLSLKTYRWSPPLWLVALTVAWSVLFYHGARTIILGQFAGISAVLIAVSIWAIKERRDVLAGCALALASPKPQMVFLLLPLVGLWGLTARRWKISAAMVVTMSVLVGLSFLFLPTWLGEMQAQLVDYTTYTYIGSPINILTTIVFPFLGAPVEWIIDGVLVVWLIWEWWQVHSSDKGRFYWVLALTLLVTNLIALRTATTNYVMMLPALFYLFATFARAKGRRANLWIAVIEIGLFVGLWALFALTVKGNGEQWPIYLPLPLGLLFALIVFRPKNQNIPGPALSQGDTTR